MKYTFDQYNLLFDQSVSQAAHLNYSQHMRREESTVSTNHPADFPRLGPDLSFQRGLDAGQITCINRLIVVLGIGLLSFPIAIMMAIGGIFFLVFSTLILWRGFLVLVGVCVRLTRQHGAIEPRVSVDLPTYSILIPLYLEARLIPQISRALSRLNWPQDRLDVQILIEVDDLETLNAATNARFPAYTRIQTVPAGGPRTKPNALNFGLSEAIGQLITVYDAEDIPHPDQLLAAHHAFSHGPDDLVCVQAPLVGEPQRGGWLSEHWALEYAVQFGLLLPGLALYRMPILIGGTSNHFRKDALQALGGWDSWNVTEDADLGMRIARAGLACGTIRPPTVEDAPDRFTPWLAQRSRWIKGFVQTWLVLMRSPGKTCRQMGLLPFLTMQLCLGGAILAPLLYMPCLIGVGLVGLWPGLALGPFGSGLLIAGVSVGLLSDMCAPGRLRWGRLAAILTRPAYWSLHSLAAYRAFWELAKAPFFWAKTPHKPRDLQETELCSTGLSASASPLASSYSASTLNQKWAPFAKKTNARISFHGD
ncbi:MAG: glycosyltransferase family 2 protein [Pseudomonadota bacterium]